MQHSIRPKEKSKNFPTIFKIIKQALAVVVFPLEILSVATYHEGQGASFSFVVYQRN